MSFGGKSRTKSDEARRTSKATMFSMGRVDRRGPDECWPWCGSLNRWGYGACQYGGKNVNASRAAYIVANGEVPEGLVICHRCDNPACCNPAHLFAATQAANLADCRAKGRAIYKYGAAHHRACAKITTDDVLAMRRRYAAGETQTGIGRSMGLHPATVSRIVRGQLWGHVA